MVLGVACSDDDADDASPDGPRVALVVEGEAILGGAILVDVPIEIRYPVEFTSCADLVAASSYVVPLPAQADGLSLEWQAAIATLRGPRTYDLAAFNGLALTARAEGGAAVGYEQVEDTQAQLVLDEDAGGTFTFSNLRDAGGAAVSGSATWTCVAQDP
jgi:hypothetical protein